MTHVLKKGLSRSERKEELRDRIIQESIILFLEQGYEQTTMRQILQKTGILSGSLYNVFKGKEEIYSAVLDKALIEVMDNAKEMLGDEVNSVKGLTFPYIMMIYAASESDKVASLLSAGFRISMIREKMIEGTVDSLKKLPNVCSRYSKEELRLRTEIGAGMMDAVLIKYSKGDVSVDLEGVVNLLIDSFVSLFGEKIDNLNEMNKEVLEIITKGNITICGVDL